MVTIFSNSFAAYRSWLGCAWLRAIEPPVNTNYKGDWLRHVVNNTGAEVVLVEARFSQPLFGIAHQLTHVKHCVVFGSLDSPPRSLPFDVLSEAEFLQGGAVRERAEPEPWDISSLIYTSGTTGRSNAVMVPWLQLKSSLESGLIPRDRLADLSLYSPYPVSPRIRGTGSRQALRCRAEWCAGLLARKGRRASSDAGEDARAPPLADHRPPPFDRTGAVRGR